MPSNLYGPAIPGLTEQAENKEIAARVRNNDAIRAGIQAGVEDTLHQREIQRVENARMDELMREAVESRALELSDKRAASGIGDYLRSLGTGIKNYTGGLADSFVDAVVGPEGPPSREADIVREDMELQQSLDALLGER